MAKSKKKSSAGSTNKKSKYGTFAEVSEFKGHPVIRLSKNDDDKFPFTMGAKKALLTVLHQKEIEDFVDGNIDLTKVEF